MKKVVRMLGLCALVALAFTACKKNDTKSVTFKAAMPTTENATRTHVEGLAGAYWLEWSVDDAIKVINDEGDAMDFTLDTYSGQDAEFKVEGTAACDFIADLGTNPYVAFYPQTSYTKGDSIVRLQIPATQTLAGGFNFANNFYPMAATYNVENSRFEFDSEAGFLYLFFTVRDGTTVDVDHLVLTTTKLNDLSGELVYNLDGTFNQFVGNGSMITASWPETVTVTPLQPVDAAILLPAGALSEGFTVTVYNGTQEVASYTAPAGTDDLNNIIIRKAYKEMRQMPLN